MRNGPLVQGKANDARNWAIWRAHRVDGANRHDIARNVGLHPSRVWMLIREYDALAQKMLNCSINIPVSDAVRDGLLGVEFVFTHEVRLDGEDDTWNWVNRRQREFHAQDEYTVYRAAQETEA